MSGRTYVCNSKVQIVVRHCRSSNPVLIPYWQDCNVYGVLENILTPLKERNIVVYEFTSKGFAGQKPASTRDDEFPPRLCLSPSELKCLPGTCPLDS